MAHVALRREETHQFRSVGSHRGSKIALWSRKSHFAPRSSPPSLPHQLPTLISTVSLSFLGVDTGIVFQRMSKEITLTGRCDLFITS